MKFCKDGIVNDFDQISNKDEDPSNNSHDNLQLVCRNCHKWERSVEKELERNVQDLRGWIKESENEMKVPFDQCKEGDCIIDIKHTDEQLVLEKEHWQNRLNEEIKRQLVRRKSLRKEIFRVATAIPLVFINQKPLKLF